MTAASCRIIFTFAKNALLTITVYVSVRSERGEVQKYESGLLMLAFGFTVLFPEEYLMILNTKILNTKIIMFNKHLYMIHVFGKHPITD